MHLWVLATNSWWSLDRCSCLKVHLCALETTLEAPPISAKQLGKNDIFFVIISGVSESHSYFSSLNHFNTHVFSLYSQLCIYVSINLYSNPSTHGWYLDWLQAVLGCNWRCIWKWWASEDRHTLGGCDWVNLEMPFGGRYQVNLEINLQSTLEWVPWGSCRLQWNSIGNALAGCDWASLEMCLNAAIMQNCTWSMWM